MTVPVLDKEAWGVFEKALHERMGQDFALQLNFSRYVSKPTDIVIDKELNDFGVMENIHAAWDQLIDWLSELKA